MIVGVVFSLVVTALIIFFWVGIYLVVSIYCSNFIYSKYVDQIDSWLKKILKIKLDQVF